MTQQSTPRKSQLSRLLGISHLLAAVAAVGVASSILLVYQFIALRQTLTADVTVQAAIIADNISASLMFRDREAAADMLRSFHPAPFLEEASVHDLGGKEFASYRRAPAATPAGGPRWSLIEPVAVTRPVVYRGSLLGHVRLVADTAGIREEMWRFGLLLGLAFAGALATSGVVSRRMRVRMAHAESELALLAYTDTVTSLPNRRASQEALETRIAHARRGQARVGLLMIDLDNFKLVNDTAGHAAGDQLLRQVATIVRAQVRDSDMVARLGGDEFVVIAGPLRNPADLHLVAQRIIDALQRPLQLDGVEFVATASIGSAFFPDDAQNADELIRNADTALYKAKGAGRNRLVQFRREMVMAAQRRAQLERDLRAALEHRRLEVFYQPQSEAASGRLDGVEALARWKHHEHGYIPPSEFIPVAEECGLIEELGKWVLERACKDMVALEQRTGRALYVAVNVSACQFRNNGFLDEVREVLARTGLPASRLELELTESVLMEDLARAVEFMHAVRACGVHIAVDDFGTGYSSLSYLQSFPIDRLKLDRSFVTPLPKEGGTLASAVITLAHSFGLTVVAEGVETEGQLGWLRDAGCDTIQGFLLGRPMPFEDLLERAGDRREERSAAAAVG